MNSSVSLRDVAEKMGLGISTVSLALRNEGTVSRKTCLRVQAVAKEMGYQASPMLAALAARRFHGGERLRHTPFVYLTQTASNAERSWTMTIHYEGFASEARRLGYQVRHQNLSDPRTARQVGDRLYRSGVAGLAFGLSSFEQDYPWDALGLERFALVACGYHPLADRINQVKGDCFVATQLAWKKAHALGYRRIGAALFQHLQTVPDDALRFAAVMEARAAADTSCDVPIFKGLHGDDEGFDAWLKQHRPDAVIGFHEGLYYRMRDLTARPGDLAAFINLHREPESSFAGVDERTYEIGVQAARLLDQAIRHNERGCVEDPHAILINPRWHDGPSLPAAPAAARRSLKKK